jgi:hypothetical protein
MTRIRRSAIGCVRAARAARQKTFKAPAIAKYAPGGATLDVFTCIGKAGIDFVCFSSPFDNNVQPSSLLQCKSAEVKVSSKSKCAKNDALRSTRCVETTTSAVRTARTGTCDADAAGNEAPW